MIAIIGGGICGLALALNLKRRGIACVVYERNREMREIGVGITLLPHAMKELEALGLAEPILTLGSENHDSRFFNRFGQLIYHEPRGRFAGYPHPEVGIHRGRLHSILYRKVREELGPEAVVLGRSCVAIDQDIDGVTLRLTDAAGKYLEPVRAEGVVACDGVNSAVRRQYVRGDAVVFTGINTWRGVTEQKSIFGGRSYLRIGSIRTGKMVIYPISAPDDGSGFQLINWVAEIQREASTANDWNAEGEVADFLPVFSDWVYEWLNVPALIRNSERVLEYPMVDKDPTPQWTFGRVTLAGDAAHPMYPRGSNGAAQAVIDARTLAEQLQLRADPQTAFLAYEGIRRDATARIVLTNRKQPPDFINLRVEDLVGDRPFDDLDAYISQTELRVMSDRYREIAGFSVPGSKLPDAVVSLAASSRSAGAPP